MANLAKSLSDIGHSVTFVAEREMSAERAAQGWAVPDVGLSKIFLAPDKETAVSLAHKTSETSVHICQGVRANGVVGAAQKALKEIGRKQFVIMETVDDSGWRGLLKRGVYRYFFHKLSPHLLGVLANGANTRDWVIKRGVPARKVFPFAYFLPETTRNAGTRQRLGSDTYRILFVGQFIELKRLDLLIKAISHLEPEKVDLAVVGSGPLEQYLKNLAEDTLPGQVDWVGSLSIEEVRGQMAQADCLVLPSRHDGWGAVVSEALMSGTPAICSDTCGAAVVANASGYGGVFKSGSVEDLVAVLSSRVNECRLTDQQSQELATWASCLGGPAGARYLIDILDAIATGAVAPQPPWSPGLNKS